LRKFLAISTIMLVFSLGSACSDKKLIPVTSIDTKALPYLYTLTVMASTAESIGQTVTAIAFTPTPTSTPTRVPDPTELRNLLTNAINGKLIAVLGAKITVVKVSYGPGGAQVPTELYIEVNCESENLSVCPLAQVVTAVIDACKEKKKKVVENIPGATQLLVITIYDPGHATQIVQADWAHVLAYLNDEITAENFSQLIRYTQIY